MGKARMKKGYAFALLFLFSCLFICGFCIFVNYLSASSYPWSGGSTLYVGGNGEANYTLIQNAIDDSSPGDMIYVYSGVYSENIVINKQIRLEGQGRLTTFIDGQHTGDIIIIKADDVEISGFSLINTGLGDSGVLLDYVTGVIIQYCNIENAYNGIRFISSDTNGIYNNTIRNSSNTGIIMDDYCNDNYIVHNNFINNIPENAYDEGYDNIWYSTEKSEGNYWDDYEGIDGNGDGIGDDPYEITGGVSIDLFPLITECQWIEHTPTASFTFILDNKTINLNASSSHDPDGTITWYNWSFGDDEYDKGMLINHTYLFDGIYTVNLTVSDDDNNTGSISKNIFVGTDIYPPEIIDNTPDDGDSGDVFTFTAMLKDAPYAQNTGVDDAWVEYWYTLTAHKQTSMQKTGEYEWKKTITLNDTFETLHYIILASDLSNNRNNTAVKLVSIQDCLKPVITNVTCIPPVIDIGGFVNITCKVSDNRGIDTVRLNISGPSDFILNTSMNNILGTDIFYYNSTYTNPGVHQYYVYVRDINFNSNISALLNFHICINDVNPPELINYSLSYSVIPIDTDSNPLWGEIMNISLDICDESNITSVIIDLGSIGGTVSFLNRIAGTNIWYINTNASIGTAVHNGTQYLPHNLEVNVTDEWGNWNHTQIELIIWKNGDVSGNGRVTLYDATYLAKWYLNIPGYDNLYENVGDVSGNGRVTLYDATYLAKWYLNIPGYEVLK